MSRVALVHVAPTHADDLGGLLVDEGADAVAFLNDNQTLKTTFGNAGPEEMEAVILGCAELLNVPVQIEFQELDDQADWATKWREHFHPLELASNVWVVPHWHEAKEVPQDAKRILIEPGLAFGTGQHPTTLLASRLLAPFAPYVERILDVGCGSGILSLLSLKLGTPRAVGLDIDPDAIRISQENAKRNALNDRLEVSLQPLSNHDHTYPLVVANIIAPVLLELASDIVRAADKLIVLSGMLTTQRDEVLSRYEALGCTLLETQERGEWLAAKLHSPQRT